MVRADKQTVDMSSRIHCPSMEGMNIHGQRNQIRLPRPTVVGARKVVHCVTLLSGIACSKVTCGALNTAFRNGNAYALHADAILTPWHCEPRYGDCSGWLKTGDSSVGIHKGYFI
jgi:hypothetical protein